MDHTIAAISTPIGEGGIGVVRLSGKRAIEVADKVFESKKGLSASRQKSFTVQYGWVVDKSDRNFRRIDEALLLVMRSPKSFTCEDTAEISCHGGRVLIQAVLDLCLKNGATLASPGEFTKRAFLNGRIDLSQAEAVIDIIRAKSDRAFHAAARQLEGSLSRVSKDIQNDLAEVLTHIEASIDFSEEDIDPMQEKDIIQRLDVILNSIKRLISMSKNGSILRDGIKIVLAGKTNVGKSSLMNALLGKQRVIVRPEPATTRDSVEELLQVGGFAVRLVDTAGIGVHGSDIDEECIKRSWNEIDSSDLTLFIVDASDVPTDEELEAWNKLGHKPRILILNKSDLVADTKDNQRFEVFGRPESGILTSSIQGKGLDCVKRRIVSFITSDADESSDETWISSVRHRDLFGKAYDLTRSGIDMIRNHESSDIVASQVRQAMDAFGEIAGDIVNEDILDRIFSKFCVGK